VRWWGGPGRARPAPATRCRSRCWRSPRAPCSPATPGCARSRRGWSTRHDRAPGRRGAGRLHPHPGRRARALACGTAAGPVHLLRQPLQPPGHGGDLVGAGPAPARPRAAGGGARLLGPPRTARLAGAAGAARGPDRPPARRPRRRSAGTGARGPRPGRFADPVPRRHAQQRTAAAAVPPRPVPAGHGLPARGARARVPRHPAPYAAQGRPAAVAIAAVLQRPFRRAAAGPARRRARCLPRTRARRGGGDGMSAQARMLWVCGGSVALLVVASVVGWLLHRRGGDGGGPTVRNLNARIRAWWGMVAVLAACFAIGPVATLVVFGVISFFA